ncbi:MAG TPA: patatin-like phospholipase family protein [Turneriella sp.]|nr:patatin-like phospholipase family protein [Turneriella sp.]
MKPRTLVDVARRSPLFKGISEAQCRRVLKNFHLHRLDKGDVLFRADQKSRVMYFVVDGKLRVEKLTDQQQLVRIASLLPGDVVGEVAVLTGERHSGQVRAMTDAQLAGITRHKLVKVLRQYPDVLFNLTRIEALRLRSNIVREHRRHNELGLVLHLYCTTSADYQAVQDPLFDAVAAQKVSSMVMLPPAFLNGVAEEASALRQRVSAVLMRHASAYLPLNIADYPLETVAALLQMADRLILTLSEDAGSVRRLQRILAQPALRGKVAMLAPVLSVVHHASPDNLTVSQIEQKLALTVRYRLRLGKDFWQKDDMHLLHLQCTTLSRIICNTTQGIAFGGGGARALCEIGVLSELERHQIEFDHVAGTSMGSIIATFYAMGLNARQMSERFREFLPSDKGLLRYNLPFVSFFRDRSVNRILRRLFGRLRIEDLPKPLTIIAADLISGQEIRMQKGLVWRAVRASMSLPVIFAPVRYHGHYLVDGGAINNVPGNVLREQGVQSVLGINCTPLADDSVTRYLDETNLFQLLKPGDRFWANLLRFFKAAKLFVTRPPILQIANRAMMLEGSELVRQKSREFDLLLSPDLSRFGLFEFDRREEIVDAGRYHARTRATELKKLFGRT